LMESCTNVLI